MNISTMGTFMLDVSDYKAKASEKGEEMRIGLERESLNSAEQTDIINHVIEESRI